MNRILTHWISPMQSIDETIDKVVERVHKATPEGWQPRVLIPAVYYNWWQGEPGIHSGLHMDLRPISESDLSWIAHYFEANGILAGAWGVPGELTAEEGKTHGLAASVVSLYVLDLEPYDEFLVEPKRDPSDFFTAFMVTAGKHPDISIDPRDHAINALGCQWELWYKFAHAFRPQCYWTDDPNLHPKVSLPKLYKRMREFGRSTKQCVPIYPRKELDPNEVTRLLGIARSPRDLWVLGG